MVAGIALTALVTGSVGAIKNAHDLLVSMKDSADKNKMLAAFADAREVSSSNCKTLSTMLLMTSALRTSAFLNSNRSVRNLKTGML